MEDHLDRKISREEATARPARSFRYEDYSTRRVFLRSYPLQWDWSEDEKQGLADDGPAKRPAYGSDDEDGGRGDERCGKGWSRQVVEAMVEWGEEKMLLLRKAKKRIAFYLIGCHRGRPALPYKSGTAAMLTSR